MKTYSITMVEYRNFTIKAENAVLAQELVVAEDWNNGTWIGTDITDCDELMDDTGREER